MASVAKEFHVLLKRIHKLTDGQANITDIDWENGNLHNFYVMICPNDGLYKDGKFKFQITLLNDYPSSPPSVYCHNDIYHPNIDPTTDCYDDSATNVCINIFEQCYWNKSFGLEGTVLSLVFLMHNPNILDPVSPYFAGFEEEEVFEQNVRKYMADKLRDDKNIEIDFCMKDGVSVEGTRQVTKAEEVDTKIQTGKSRTNVDNSTNDCSETEPPFDAFDADGQGAKHVYASDENEKDESLNLTSAFSDQNSDEPIPRYLNGNCSDSSNQKSNYSNNNTEKLVTEEPHSETDLCIRRTVRMHSHEEVEVDLKGNESIFEEIIGDIARDGQFRGLQNPLIKPQDQIPEDTTAKSECTDSEHSTKVENVSCTDTESKEENDTGKLGSSVDHSNDINYDHSSAGGLELRVISGESFLLVHDSLNSDEKDEPSIVVDSFQQTTNGRLILSSGKFVTVFQYIHAFVRNCYMRLLFRVEMLKTTVTRYLNWR